MKLKREIRIEQFFAGDESAAVNPKVDQHALLRIVHHLKIFKIFKHKIKRRRKKYGRHRS